MTWKKLQTISAILGSMLTAIGYLAFFLTLICLRDEAIARADARLIWGTSIYIALCAVVVSILGFLLSQDVQRTICMVCAISCGVLLWLLIAVLPAVVPPVAARVQGLI